MKNVLSMIFAIAIAIILGNFFMKISGEKTVETVTMSELKAFQLGAYENYDLAKNASRENTVIVKDKGYYYIYGAILSDQVNIEKMIKKFKDQNVYYYIKTVESNDAFLNELYKYESMMKETTSEVAFNELNRKILDLYRRNFSED